MFVVIIVVPLPHCQYTDQSPQARQAKAGRETQSMMLKGSPTVPNTPAHHAHSIHPP